MAGGWSWDLGREWNRKQREDLRQRDLSCAHLSCTPYTLEGNLIGARQETSERFSGLGGGPCLNGHFPVTPAHPSRHSDKLHMFQLYCHWQKVTGDTVITVP